MEQTAWPKLAVSLFTFVDVHPRNNNFNNLQKDQNKSFSALHNEDLILVISLGACIKILSRRKAINDRNSATRHK